MRSARSAQFVLCSATILLSVACNKGPSFGPGGGAGGLRSVFEDNIANATQQFQVDAASGGRVEGAKGVRVTFPPNAFHTVSGGVVSGNVEVSLVEVTDIADMIMLNTTTVGNDNGTLALLKSGGALYVSASQGTNELVLGPQGMNVTVPTPAIDTEMAVFTADRTQGEELVWNAEDSTSIDSVIIETPNGWYWGYSFQADSLQWINCDYFPYSSANTFISAITPADVPNDSTIVWFVFPDLNAVTYTAPSAPNMFGFGTVPVGLQAIAVGLTRSGSQYRSSFSSFTTTTNGSVGLSFQPTSLQAFETALDNL